VLFRSDESEIHRHIEEHIIERNLPGKPKRRIDATSGGADRWNR